MDSLSSNDNHGQETGNDDVAAFLDQLKQFQVGLRSGGPEPDVYAIQLFIDNLVEDEQQREDVERNIFTWRRWFAVYCESLIAGWPGEEYIKSEERNGSD